MSEQVKIKLVEGSTYGCPQFPREDKTLKRGESITLDKALADKLLEDSFTDKAGKTRYYFEEVDTDEDDEDGEGGGEGGSDTEPATKTAANRRTAAKAAPRKRS